LFQIAAKAGALAAEAARVSARSCSRGDEIHEILDLGDPLGG
jgi:hypothetical protein